MGYNSVADN